MKNLEIAKVYSKAILESTNDPDKLLSELKEINKIIESNNDLYNLLNLEIFQLSQKNEILDEIFDKTQDLSNQSKALGKTLVEKKRINILEDIIEVIQTNKSVENNEVELKVIGSYQSITADLVDKLINKASSVFELKNKKIQVNYKYNESIKSGVKVFYGDLLLDLTLEKQLNNLTKHLYS